ncbi:TPA: glycoside hydrolase family protein [Escherichia coli]|nr:glycoside hydrolase family protein [Escherichia coli]HBZ8229064.1 glycoside hydrolase family protein [Escherichia coli]HBZ8345792.1 glycoside hydrolase family protein [Escherichia coli]HBZ8350861.1 glycoside hydrolase family protein [Escherichia coli]HBZ8356193.1 glycoside hydrolase family protein [Escherichia coli]
MKLTQMIRYDEGEKLTLYKDTEGYWTIGVGHLLTKQPSRQIAIQELSRAVGRQTDTITQAESLKLLEKDLERTVKEAMSLSVTKTLDDARQKAVCNMVFQLGLQGVKGFRKMLQALEQKDYTRASKEALDSKWARQTPNRARRVTEVLRTGNFDSYR